MNSKKGFTLLEILLVIAAIGILAAIVIVAINPTRQLAQARNGERRSEIRVINDAIIQYNIDTQSYPAGITRWYKDICPVGGGIDCVDLSVLVPTYMAGIPRDPNGTSAYRIAIDESNRVSVRAGGSELGASIAVNPLPSVATFARRAGGVGNDTAYGVASLSDGSSIVTGSFSGTVIFGQGEVNETSLVSSGAGDIFIAKYNSNGELVWARGVGGTGEDIGYGVTPLQDNSFVATGYFRNTVTFGQGDPNQTSLVSAGSSDIFISKYNADGSLAWAKRAGGRVWESAYEISSFPDGSTVITGDFDYANEINPTVFGPGEANETILTGLETGYGMYLAKYNADGTLAWVKNPVNVNSSGYNFGLAVSAFPDGSTVVTGYYDGNHIWGEGEPNEFQSGGPGGTFVAKYNVNGTLAWVKPFTTSQNGNYTDGYGVDSSEDGSSVVTGYYDNITLGYGEPNQTSLPGEGVYLAKYNPDGTLAWAKSASGSNSLATSVEILNDGSIIINGFLYANNPLTFGQGEINETVLSTLSDNAMFIAKYSQDGNLIWAKKGITNINTFNTWTIGKSLAVYEDGGLSVVGAFSGNTILGQGDPNESNYTSAGSRDIFISKFNSDGKLE